MTPPIRICEWGHTTRHDLNTAEREGIARAAARWQAENRFPQPPLWFTGTDGRTLNARQYIGVVEAAGRTVEIYPKLDAHLLEHNDIDDGAPLAGVMSAVLWMMDIAGVVEASPADTTQLGELPTDFIDVFALLLAKNLRAELARGMARRYERQEENLTAVRGRVDIGAQISRNFNRVDRLACVWDEFTGDTPMNCLLRCACRSLLPRTRHPGTKWLLQDCLSLLDDVADVGVVAALQGARHLRHWDRGMERFRRPFELAHRLLRGFGHALEAAEADTFVFLIDMNTLFQSYVHAALAAHFQTNVEPQTRVGSLLSLPDRIRQLPDFRLTDNTGAAWIGDAKYKHLARGHDGSATFAGALPRDDDLEATTDSGGTPPRKGTTISPDDVRQLTVYAELDARRRGIGGDAAKAGLLLLYPFIGSGKFEVDTATAWNGSAFHLVPVWVSPTPDLANVLPCSPWRI